MNSSMHLIYYLCGHLKVVMAHEHENDICPNNLPESETADEDCYHCEGKKKGYEGNPRPIEHEDDFEIIYNDPEDDDDDGDDDGYDGDDELAYDEGVSPAVAQTRPFDPEDTLENWLDHIRLSAVGECDCVVCESDRAKLKDPQKKLRVVS